MRKIGDVLLDGGGVLYTPAQNPDFTEDERVFHTLSIAPSQLISQIIDAQKQPDTAREQISKILIDYLRDKNVFIFATENDIRDQLNISLDQSPSLKWVPRVFKACDEIATWITIKHRIESIRKAALKKGLNVQNPEIINQLQNKYEQLSLYIFSENDPIMKYVFAEIFSIPELRIFIKQGGFKANSNNYSSFIQQSGILCPNALLIDDSLINNSAAHAGGIHSLSAPFNIDRGPSIDDITRDFLNVISDGQKPLYINKPSHLK